MLSDLPNLTHLRILAANIQDEDLSLLSGLTNLTWLGLSHNRIADISPLAELTGLTGLWLLGKLDRGHLGAFELDQPDIPESWKKHRLGHLGAFGLTNLTELFLNDNNITYVSSLSGLTNLTFLDLSANSIEDISPLSGLTNLRDLDLRGNPYEALPKGDFDIELVLLDDFNESQKQVLQYVARRWMAVITEDLPDYEFAEGWSGTCGGQSFEIPAGERIDDLRIYVKKERLSVGTFLGLAGLRWCCARQTHLPVFGCMGIRFEPRQFADYRASTRSGTFWGLPVRYGAQFGFYQNPPNGDAALQRSAGDCCLRRHGRTGLQKCRRYQLQTSESHWRVPVSRGRTHGAIVVQEGRSARSRFSPWPISATAWMSRRPTPIPCPVPPPPRRVRRSRPRPLMRCRSCRAALISGGSRFM